MKYIILLLFAASSIFAQNTWVKRSNGLPDSLLYPVLSKIDACDSSTAILFCHPVGPEWFSSAIFLTNDAGMNWKEIIGPEDVIDYSITCGSIVDKDHFWFCTGEFAPNAGKIFGTVDGGKTWTKQFDNPDVTNYLNYIKMFDALNGVAMGDPASTGFEDKPAVFLKTTDGGNNWKQMNTSQLRGAVSEDVWRRVDFLNENTGYFCASGQLYKTNDGGAAFNQINFDDQLTVFKFYNQSIGISFITKTSGNSYTSRTTDGGNTWSIARFPMLKGQGWGNDIEFIEGNPAKVWGAQAGGLFFSDDTGKTWFRNYLEGTGTIYDIEFPDSRHGWLLSNNSIWYTTNGDLVVTHTSDINNSPSEFRLFQNYPNPFNPSTQINYEINSASYVQLKVFNILGSEITSLVSEFQKPGQYKVNYEPSNLSGGIYLIQLTAGTQVDVRKMIYLK